jgi:molecular chaperone GrpE
VTSAEHQHESTPAEEAVDASARAPQETAAPGSRREDAAAKATGEQAPEGGEGMANDTPTELVADLAKAQEDVATLTGDPQRLQAEYVNYKRRVDRDRELVKENATFAVLSALLPALDDIDRAREHGEVEGGFKAVADSLERIVAVLGLDKFGAPGDEFDPNLHEALMHGHSPEVTTTTCQNIVQAGYRIGDRVVRPARVTVVDPEPAAQGQAQGQAEGQGEPGGEPSGQDR